MLPTLITTFCWGLDVFVISVDSFSSVPCFFPCHSIFFFSSFLFPSFPHLSVCLLAQPSCQNLLSFHPLSLLPPPSSTKLLCCLERGGRYEGLHSRLGRAHHYHHSNLSSGTVSIDPLDEHTQATIYLGHAQQPNTTHTCTSPSLALAPLAPLPYQPSAISGQSVPEPAKVWSSTRDRRQHIGSGGAHTPPSRPPPSNLTREGKGKKETRDNDFGNRLHLSNCQLAGPISIS